MTNKKDGVLYIGVTSDLKKRVYEHKNNLAPGFCEKYNLDKLVYAESFPSMLDAIAREKQLKKWNRDWKIELIEKENPKWNDLYEGLF